MNDPNEVLYLVSYSYYSIELYLYEIPTIPNTDFVSSWSHKWFCVRNEWNDWM